MSQTTTDCTPEKRCGPPCPHLFLSAAPVQAWMVTRIGMLDYRQAVVVNSAMRRGQPDTTSSLRFRRAFIEGMRWGGRTGWRGRQRLWCGVLLAFVTLGWDVRGIPYSLGGYRRRLRLWDTSGLRMGA